MKKNSTFLAIALCLAFTFTNSTTSAQGLFQVNFNTVPSLISGSLSALTAKYRFYSVRTNMDAIVTVQSATNGASIDIFDDNNVSKPEAFSPKIKVPAHKSGMVEFKITFVYPLSETAYPMDSLYATAIDIDGSDDVHEMDAIDMGSGAQATYVSANPEISLVRSGTVYTGTNTAGKEYDGVDSMAKQVMFTVKNKNVASFIYKAGANNQSNSEISRQKSIYFKNFVYANATTLPVRYSSFDATVIDNKAVMLKWVTTLELNNGHFEVERSFSNDFSTIGLVLDAESVVNNNRTYRFKDNSEALKGKSVVYYRLKQVDVDGKATYSTIIAVRLQATNSDVEMQAAPNPFTEKLYVRFTAAENGTAEMQISNLAGQTVVSKQSIISKGYNNLQVDGLSRLAPGMYVAKLIMNGSVIGSQKIIKN
jgi:hypothetical protein